VLNKDTHAMQHHMDVLALGKKHPDFQASMAYLIRHPDASLTPLHEHLSEQRRGWRTVPALLVAIGRVESVSVLAKALSTAMESDSWMLGAALGRFPIEMSAPALRAALKSSREAEVIAAIRGLSLQKNTAACEALTDILKGTAPQPRYHALRACFELECISTEELKTYLDDSDGDIVTLAQSLLSSKD
jgi:HEAT repeat protein